MQADELSHSFYNAAHKARSSQLVKTCCVFLHGAVDYQTETIAENVLPVD